MPVKSGNVWYCPFTRVDIDGAAVTGSVLADFTITDLRNAGSVSLTWAVDEVGSGDYVAYATVNTLGAYRMRIRPATGTDIILGGIHGVECVSVLVSDVFARLVQTGGRVTSDARSTNDNKTLVENDSVYMEFLIPDAALSIVGAADLTDLTDISIGAKPQNAASDSAAVWRDAAGGAPGTGNWSIVTNNPGERLVRLDIAAWPSDLNIAAGEPGPRTLEYHIQLTKSAKRWTSNEGNLTITSDRENAS